MRYLIFSLLFLIYHPASATAQHSFADSIIQKAALEKTVSFLSSDSLKGRFTGSEGAEKAAAYIAQAFANSNLQPIYTNNKYFHRFTDKHNGKEVEIVNVVGQLPSTFQNDTTIILSAHYDHIGQGTDFSYTSKHTDDDIYNGANDNVTGVAALLELAKYYSAKNNNRYRLLFVAFSGEELGLLGSKQLAKDINSKLIKAVINIEMLGRPTNSKCFIAGTKVNKIIKSLNKCLKKNDPKRTSPFFEADPYPDEFLSTRSDHYSFARKVKAAFTIMGSSPKDEYYHTVDDEFNTINFDFLLTATKNIALACTCFIE